MSTAFKEYFNPWRNGKTLQWAIDNDEEFVENLMREEIRHYKECIFDNLGDQIAYNNSENSKEWSWADRNYYELQFELTYSPSWYWNGDKDGTWQDINVSYLEDNQDLQFKAGILIGTIGNFSEIEIQAENGETCYINMDGCFELFARVA